MIGRCRSLIIVIALTLSGNVYAYSDKECLAYTLYKEANTESLRGRRAVLDVLYNRMRIRAKSACQVIKERNQFSWYKAGMRFKVTIDMLTDFFLVDNMSPVLPKSVEYFHHKGVRPTWARRFSKAAVIGHHVFYSDRRFT